MQDVMYQTRKWHLILLLQLTDTCAPSESPQHLSPPTSRVMSTERTAFRAEVAQVERWWKVCTILFPPERPPTLVTPLQNPRFARVRRPYTAADVVSKRGTLQISYPADVVAKKAFKLFSEHFKRRTPSHTYGAYVLPRLFALAPRHLIWAASQT
jgi:hypothetical protein